MGAASPQAASDTPHPGEAIYKDQCATCHGPQGQGVADKFDEPLTGKRSLESLTGYITRNMPEEDPDLCVGEDAAQVAAYIYDAFYSPEAQHRIGNVPRIELARLTVPQFQNAIADLLGSFIPQPSPEKIAEGQPGLQAEYFESKGMNKANEQKMERVDRRVDFDFGTEGPREDIAKDQFAIIWQGSLHTRLTGDYEFRVTTPNGVRLYLNVDNMENRQKLRDDSSVAGQAALIDEWVSSGKSREHDARVYLLGGRRYPIRLEFFKYMEETASIRMEWKPPQGTWSVLDHRFLDTAPASRTFVVETPFPPDDRSLGYERGNAVSPAWQTAVMNAATETATEVVNRLPLLAKLDKDKSTHTEEIRPFLLELANQAFRRPLTEEEKTLFGERLLETSETEDIAVRRAVLLMLSSPNFLYTEFNAGMNPTGPFARAARLAWALWDSLPDRTLRAAAAEGQLETPADLLVQAQRMVRDPRAYSKLRRFFDHWLELEERDLMKDRRLFPEFDDRVIADLRYSLDLFLDQVIQSEASDYRELLQADYLILNRPLMAMYHPDYDPKTSIGINETASRDPLFARVIFEPGRRSGILTHPYLLSAYAYHNNTSPIHRGVFLTRNIMGRGLRPPPVAVAFKDEEFPEDATMREKITQLTSDKACISCHSVINPLGFSLEHFDAVGRWRLHDNDKPVDSRSEYITENGESLWVEDASDIAQFAVGSELAHEAFVNQLFHHLIHQDTSAYGPETSKTLRLHFSKNNFSIRSLMVQAAILASEDSPYLLTQKEP